MFEVACTLGLTIGAMISGGLVERFGYTIMAWSFSKLGSFDCFVSFI